MSLARTQKTDAESPNTDEPNAVSFRRGPKDSGVSRNFYISRYVTHGIRRHKRRSLSLLIGIMIGVALVSSVFVWTETGARVAIDDYFAQIAFHYYCVQGPSNNDPHAIFPVKEFVDAQVTTQTSHLVYSSIALIDTTDLDPTDQYLPYPYQRGIKDCQVFFTDNTFLERASRSFRIIDGDFKLDPGEVLVSQNVVEDLNQVMGRHVSVGSVIDLSVARDYRITSTFGAIDPTNINGLRIAGIYEVISRFEPLQEAFPSQSRLNWGPIYASEIVFGWFDGVIVSSDIFSNETLDQIAEQVMVPRLLVEITPAPLYSVGLEAIIGVLDRLFTDIQLEYSVSIGGRDQLQFLQAYITVYYERQTMVFLILPIVILSVLLTTFTASLFLSNRRSELALLRARGASYQQLYSILMVEFFILALLGTIAGGFLGIFLGCLIPSATSFLIFNLGSLLHHLSLTTINLVFWGLAGFVCILPAAAYVFLNTRSFLKSEVYAELRENNSSWKYNPRIQFAYAIGVILLTIPLVYFVLFIPLSLEIALIVFILIVSFWILLSDAVARIIRPGIATFSKIFTPAIGQKSQLFSKTLTVKRTRVVPLLMILLLTFSITIFSAVEAQTYHNHIDQQVQYYVGGDIRIYTQLVVADRVNDITSLSAIHTATAFIEVQAEIALSNFKLIAVNPTAYAEVGNWDETSMMGEDYQTVLNRLAANYNGIILPAHLASLYDKRVGDTIPVTVRDQRTFIVEVKEFDIVGIMNKAPGLGYSNPSDPQASITSNPGFGFQKNEPFALCNQHYFLVEIPSFDPYSIMDTTNSFIAGIDSASDIQTAQHAVESLGFVYRTWSPFTFDLEEAYPDGYLFAQGIIGLLSVGFLASLAISIVALTVFVSTIVAERKTEYAIMRALGGSRHDVTSMVLVEFVSIILLAFFFSIIIGINFSWLLMFVIIKLFPQPFIVPFTIIYPMSLLVAILGLVILGLVTGAYFPARRAGQVQVSNLLRNL
ncbi:MAG: FtsX-like permease family protein [Promethearchaeota archaeon]